jgi:hypothetical protein
VQCPGKGKAAGSGTLATQRLKPRRMRTRSLVIDVYIACIDVDFADNMG